uniref:Uncharacterized protein n=1 Tax=Anopheles dirus TaxID=7168 RepID=A0A182NYR4_9DIPT
MDNNNCLFWFIVLVMDDKSANAFYVPMDISFRNELNF